MAIRAASLEDYLKNYRSGKAISSKPKSLYEYMLSSGKDPDGAYRSAIRSALTERATAGGGYGSEAERLGRAGLSSSGYREHLEELAEQKLRSSSGAAYERRADEYTALHSGYEDYLKSYAQAQTDVKDELRKYLLSNGIMGLEDSFALGVERGLSADEAASLSAEVYSLLKDRVFNECLRAASSAALDLDGIRAYAERAGLIGDDVNALVKEAREYATDKEKYSDAYLKYLEEQANE